ncbi:hypothetical protein [Microscilla marina]|nr:hypothetical protein [Microscilla marina]
MKKNKIYILILIFVLPVLLESCRPYRDRRPWMPKKHKKQKLSSKPRRR